MGTWATGRRRAARWRCAARAEAAACAKKLGASQVLDIHDGELVPSLENRKLITRVIREWKADIVIAHRPWDYHPDHRAAHDRDRPTGGAKSDLA
jgi:LmbE family N-acetylglucosaminyl deacetylase